VSDLVDQIIVRVREERFRRGWSARTLSEMVEKQGVVFPRAVITNLENGRRELLTIDEVVAVSDVYGWSLDWLVLGIGIQCQHCQDAPPAGYRCIYCGKESEDDVIGGP